MLLKILTSSVGQNGQFSAIKLAMKSRKTPHHSGETRLEWLKAISYLVTMRKAQYCRLEASAENW